MDNVTEVATSKFSKDLIENYNEDSDEGCFHKVDAQSFKKLNDNFYLKEWKLRKLEN